MEKQKERYYAGIRLQEDLDMCAAYDALSNNNDVIILAHGRDVLVHEMKYVNNYNQDREDTGKTHMGFDFNYITFYYNGRVWNVEPSTYYPFTDENNPGKLTICPRKLIDGWYEEQEGYRRAYVDLSSCDKIDHLRASDKVYAHAIPWKVNKTAFDLIVKNKGGNREKAIFNAPHICYVIQDDESRLVVRCSKLERESDGVRLSFDVDMKHETITN